MNFETYFKNLLTDIEVSVSEKVDRNFETKSFFGQAWPAAKLHNNKGSLMNRSGGLRGSLQRGSIEGDRIVWRSSRPYASLQNEGGTITVTPQMIKFFWAMYYKASGAMSKKKDGSHSKNQRNHRLTAEAATWKALALQKPGSKMTIPKRQFIGNHPVVDAAVQSQCDKMMQQVEADMATLLKPGT